VKLSQFYDLCAREWAKPRRGDVVSLCLTEASREELARDVIASGALTGFPAARHEIPSCSRVQDWAVSTVVNPVTRTTVAIRTKKTGTRDTARVAVMGGTYRQAWWASSGT
jgi:hypothetical protein